MSFLQPWAFLLLGLSVPLLLLYFLKVRRQQRRVSSVLLWSPVFRDQQASALFQRLQLDPLLLLQLLALLLLCAALARPTLTLQGKGAERLIFVVDTSASMQARDVGSSRIREAQQQAAGLIAEAGQGAEMMVIEAGSQPTIRLHFTRDRDRARRAVYDLERAGPAEPPERGDPDGAGAGAIRRPAGARARPDRRGVRPGPGPGVPRPARPVGHGRRRRP